MPLGDVVLDGRLHQVWGYLLSNRHLCVPESWRSAVAAFERDLNALEARLHLGHMKFRKFLKVAASPPNSFLILSKWPGEGARLGRPGILGR